MRNNILVAVFITMFLFIFSSEVDATYELYMVEPVY